MNRRDTLLGLVTLGVASTPPRPLAQQSRKVHRIGAPMIAPRHTIRELLAAFEQGLREHGLVSGQNVIITDDFERGFAAALLTRTLLLRADRVIE